MHACWPAPLDAALPAAAAGAGAAAREADERAGGRASSLGLSDDLELLRAEGFLVNRKRVERLWRLEGHRVPPRRSQTSGKRAQGTAENASWNRPAIRPNDVWSYDCMSSMTRDGRPLRILNVVDEHTRVAVGCRVARSIGAKDVIAESLPSSLS